MNENGKKSKRNNCPMNKNTNMATDGRSISSRVPRGDTQTDGGSISSRVPRGDTQMDGGSISSRVLSGDTQTDAVAEVIQIQSNPSSDDAEYDPDLFSKVRAQPETEVKTRQMASAVSQSTADHTFLENKHFYPEELKYDCLEILILSTEADENEATSMKEAIENNVLFCGKLKPAVTLLRDVIPINEYADPLDDAFKRTIYLMLYVTEEFCQHYVSLHQGLSCLRRALNRKEDRWSIIPVHTAPKNVRNYELPLMLDGLRPLNYFSRTFYDDVKKLLEHKSNVILDRRATLVKKREQYKIEKHEKLEQWRHLSEGMKNVTEPALKMHENKPEAPTKVPVSESVLEKRTSVKAQEQHQVLDSNPRSSQQKTKNIAATLQQQKSNQDVTMSSEASGMKTYLRPKRFESEDYSEDYSLAVTTDSPSSAEFADEPSEKDVSIGPIRQVGLPNDFDNSRNNYSSTVISPIVTSSSPAEPVDDKAIPENLTLNAFPAARFDMSQTGSRPNFPTGQRNTSSHTDMSGIFSEGAQTITQDTVPNISQDSGNSARVLPEVPRNPNSINIGPENTYTVSGSEIHIHIHHADLVALKSQVNVHGLLPTNEDNVESEDSDD